MNCLMIKNIIFLTRTSSVDNMAGTFVRFKPICRFFHSTYYNLSNVHKTFRKVLSRNSTKKRKLNFADFPVLQSHFKEVEGKNKLKPVFRRVNVLNKTFMGYITDLIVNGEHWQQYDNLGIEITRVEISKDYKILNIFWIDKKAADEKEIVKFLTENSFILRHELSQLKVIGMVPPVSFVKDKNHTHMMELDKRMSQADYGDDYEPLSVTRLKHQLELYCPLEEDIKCQLEKLEAISEEETMAVDIPVMPQNVLGLDHADIMKRILIPKKIQTANISAYRCSDRSPDEDVGGISSRDAFKIFLHKRQLMSQNMKKENKNYDINKEYIKEELIGSFEEHDDNADSNFDKFDDFIEDESDKK